jgi:hypothetical protein
MPSSKESKKPKSKTGAKKGGVVEFAPLTAAGILYASAYYGKSSRGGRRIKGGDDVMNTVPGGSVPVISAGKPEMPYGVTPAVPGQAQQAGSYIPSDVRSINPATAGSDGGSESKSPLVKGELNLTNNPYIGAAASSRAAPINEPPGLLQQGGAKKAKKAKKDKKHGGAEVIIGSAVQSPLVTYQLPHTKNNDYVGGISASRPAPLDAPSTLMGGAKKGKGKGKGRKQKGGDDQIAYLPKELMPASTSPATPLPPVPSMASQSCGHIAAPIPPGTSSGGRLGLSDVVPGAVGGVSGQEEPSQFGGAKKGKKGAKGKKRGGDFDSAVGGVEDQETLAAVGGGKKKDKKDRKKKGGNQEEDNSIEGGETAERMIVNYQGGADKKKASKGKKRGGAEVEPFNAGNATQADALGGFDSLLSDLKQQVGGKYKKKGGAFKLYARELSSLSKKLQKLV